MKRTLIANNHVQIGIGTVLITRTSWKKENNDFIISSGEVRRELVERCIKQFEEMGVAQAEFYFDHLEYCTVSPTDYRLHSEA